MSKRLFTLALTLAVIVAALGAFPVVAQDDCDFVDEVVIGVIAPLTGDIPKVGQSTVEAANMAVEEINAKCGLTIDDESYEVVIVIEDNESKAESSVSVATRLIVEENVVAIIGPQASKQAVPTGQVANDR